MVNHESYEILFPPITDTSGTSVLRNGAAGWKSQTIGGQNTYCRTKVWMALGKLFTRVIQQQEGVMHKHPVVLLGTNSGWGDGGRRGWRGGGTASTHERSSA